ncbi:transcriptional regulator [Virgisporangium aliadipatigenens]|uniref:Transcriptional regulator n=1 Tax=Virgisporangium aliadipatigenens TaxID=741659 RepID=A0A8J3YK89_9ACTN|nr:LuxR family transcriptional regulator [Virgisporangium aliadipatigenens]GIJ45480.1 transcriptional regulator [Virgisporangium aliadipatigenens]
MQTGEFALYGRARECAYVDVLLDKLRHGTGSGVVFAGPTGIGKSALVDYVLSRSADDLRVLYARGVAAESGLAFAGLHELLAPVLGFLPGIPQRQRAVLSAAFALSDDADAAADPFVAGAGALHLLAAAAAEGPPVLVVVDDLDRWDATSRRVLLFVARRAASAGIGMVLTTAGGPGVEDEWGLPAHRLAPLDPAASAALVRRASPVPPAEAIVGRLVAAASGLPLALVELPAQLSVEQLGGATPAPDPLPVGEAVRRMFGARLAGYGRPARTALLVAAAAGPVGLRTTLDALVALGVAETALDVAEDDGLVTLDSDGVAFRHPLVRALAYHDAPLPERRAAHAALAAVTTGEERARHLAAGVPWPDERVAAELERVATSPVGHLSAGACAELLARAADLSVDRTARARRSVRAAELWGLAGAWDSAGELLERVPRLTDDVAVRAGARAVHARGVLLRGRPVSARRVLVSEAVRIRAAHPAGATVLLLDAAEASWLAGEGTAALLAVRHARRLAAPGPLDLLSAVQSATVLAHCGHGVEARELFDERRVALARRLAEGPVAPGWWRVVRIHLPRLLARLGHLEPAAALLDETLTRATRRSALGVLPALLVLRAELGIVFGDWIAARSAAERAVETAGRTGQSADAAAALLILGWLAGTRGDAAACREFVARAREIVDRHRLGGLDPALHAAEAHLDLAGGDPEAAFARLERAGRQAEADELVDCGPLPWIADLAEAAVATGRTGQAQRLLAAARRQDRLAPPVLARAAALVAGEAGGALFAEAVGAGAGPAGPFEHARAALCYGEWLTRRGQRGEALPLLRAALVTFTRMNVTPWTARAQRALASVDAASPEPGPAPPAPAAADLTVQEQRVTMLVGQGATNREAARALFVSPKTIEFHLRSIYRKLGVRSRAELAHRLGRGRLTDAAR